MASHSCKACATRSAAVLAGKPITPAFHISCRPESVMPSSVLPDSARRVRVSVRLLRSPKQSSKQCM